MYHVGIELTFSDANVALVWNDGYFYELSEAYEAELLTTDDLERISKEVNKRK